LFICGEITDLFIPGLDFGTDEPTGWLPGAGEGLI